MSDWEKLARPPQSHVAQAAAANKAKQTPQSPKTEKLTTPPLTEASSPKQDSSEKSSGSQSTASGNNEDVSPAAAVDTPQTASDNTATSINETTTAPSSKDTNASTSTPSQNTTDSSLPPPASSEDSAVESSSQRLPTSDLWSLHVPEDDMASASHEEEPSTQTPTQTEKSQPLDGQSSDCAAAAGEVSSSEQQSEAETAGGACGAADLPAVGNPEAELPESEQTQASEVSDSVGPSGETPKPSSASCDETPAEISSCAVTEPTEPPKQLSDQDVAEKMKLKVKGDMVVVGDRGSPSSEESSEAKGDLEFQSILRTIFSYPFS